MKGKQVGTIVGDDKIVAGRESGIFRKGEADPAPQGPACKIHFVQTTVEEFNELSGGASPGRVIVDLIDYNRMLETRSIAHPLESDWRVRSSE